MKGRSFEVGNQVLISSHRKLLSSKATVVDSASSAREIDQTAPNNPIRGKARRMSFSSCRVPGLARSSIELLHNGIEAILLLHASRSAVRLRPSML
jgi:hypothetical protein